MAPLFKHGKGTVMLFNNANMSGILTTSTLTASVDTADTTTYGNDDYTYIPGQRTSDWQFGGLFDGTALSTASTASTGALDAKFMNALQASTDPLITWGPGGSAIGSKAVIARTVQTSYVATAMASDAVRVTASAKSNNRADYGVWLLPPVARTSTSSTTASVNSGIAGGTLLGGVASFHMLADSTLTSFIAKVQHSSLGSVWADLITFTATTATTSANSVQRSTVSGTIKQFTRGIISTFTGGAPKSVTVGVAFARRNVPL